MEQIIMYSTGCPRCNILKKKLEQAGIPFEENTDEKLMLSMGFEEVPILKVNNTFLSYTEAVKWISGQEDMK